jgi:hypothetical protein
MADVAPLLATDGRALLVVTTFPCPKFGQSQSIAGNVALVQVMEIVEYHRHEFAQVVWFD